MEAMRKMSRVYVRLGDRGQIIRCEGGYSMDNITRVEDWTLIDEGIGVRFDHCQGNYFAGGLYTEDGIPRYRLENGKPVLRSDAELEADRAARPEPPPSQLDRVEAQAAFTAMMTGTLLS